MASLAAPRADERSDTRRAVATKKPLMGLKARPIPARTEKRVGRTKTGQKTDGPLGWTMTLKQVPTNVDSHFGQAKASSRLLGPGTWRRPWKERSPFITGVWRRSQGTEGTSGRNSRGEEEPSDWPGHQELPEPSQTQP